VLLFDDGISVKAQKPERGQTPTSRNKRRPNPTKVWGASLTDVVVLQTSRSGGHAPIVADGSLRCSLAQVVQAKVQQIYADRALPYPGGDLRWARTIRQRWTQTFGKDVVVILDWYHLTQKLRNLMSMIVAKTDKQAHLKVLFTHLWQVEQLSTTCASKSPSQP